MTVKETGGIVLLFSLAMSSCQTQSPDVAAVEAGVRGLLQQYSESINSGDWSGVLDLYSDDKRFHWAEDGQLAYPSKAAVAAGLEGLASSLESTEIRAGEVQITALSDRHALAAFSYEQSLVFSSGQSFRFSGFITMTLQREGADWKILAGHSSSPRRRQ